MLMLSVDDNLPLPWWEFGPDVLSQEESAAQQSELDRVEDLLPGFFQAGARWEVAEKFISGIALLHARRPRATTLLPRGTMIGTFLMPDSVREP